MIKKTFTLVFISFMLFGFLGAQSVVFHEDFEQPSGADSVTTYSSDSGNVNTWGISTDLAAGGLQSDSAICSPNDTLTLTTNTFSTSGNAYVILEFDHIAKIEIMDKGIVEVSTDDGASWTKLDSTHYTGSSSHFGDNGNLFNASTYSDWKSSQIVTPDNSWWKHETFNISSIAADESNVQVRFSLIDENGLTSFENYGWFLDNIEVIAATSEMDPPDITMTTTPTGDVMDPNPLVEAEITDASGVDTAYVIYSTNGGTTDTTGMNNTSGNTYEASMPLLNFGDTVSYFVEAIDAASAANIDSSQKYSYIVNSLLGLNCTSGGASDVIFVENWDGGQGNWTGDIGTSNTEWNFESGSTGSSDTGPDGPHDGSQYIYFEASSSGTATMVSPAIDLANASDQAALSFWMHAYGGDFSGAQLTISVGTSSSGPFTTEYDTTFNSQIQSSSSDPYEQQIIDLTSYIGQQIYLEIEFTTSSTNEADLALDLFELYTCVSCAAPYNFTDTNITSNSVDLSWTDPGTASNWQVEYGNSGFTPGNGTDTIVNTTQLTITGLSSLSDYDFYVRSICSAGDTSIWEGPLSFMTDFQCPPLAYCFTNAGATGPMGPSQSDVDAEYNGTKLDGDVTITGKGIQKWTVPKSMTYKITAMGAQGGHSDGGKGAKAYGEFDLNSGDELMILVGQRGEFENAVGAGGGGTFVVDTTSGSVPLIIAGGGGGGNSNYTGEGGLDQTSTTPDGGSNAGGGGYMGDGATSNTGTAAESFINGGEGGEIDGTGSAGGFGGGGGGDDDGSASSNDLGGGGGYEGGDGHNNGGGYGGYAYNAGNNSSLTADFNKGHGRVIIEPGLILTNAPNDAGVSSIDEPMVFCPDTQDVIVTIQNFGNAQIDSVDIEWSVDGVQQTPVTYTDTLDTLGGSGSSNAQVNLGSYDFDTNAPYTVKAWTVNPNGVTDTVNNNDTTTATIQSNLPAPTNLTILDSTAQTVTFDWNIGSSQNSWIYVVVPKGDAPQTGNYVSTSTDSATATGLNPLTAYDIYVAEVCPGGTDTSAWAGPATFTTSFYCPPAGYCFNHAGATGRFGPSQSGVDSAYTGTNLAGDVSVSGSGIQRWVVPSSGMYEITVAGAKGGGPAGGSGAKMKGWFILSADDTLNILVGQKGETGGSRMLTGSGGGGSFVVDDNNNPLIVAGGGGGGADSTQSERHGTTASAHDGKCPVGGDSDNCDYNGTGGATDETYSPGGVFGTDAGVAGRRGGGGAGFSSDGEDGQSSSSEGGGIAYVNGGEGGEGDEAVGGFGGGGGARESGFDGGGGGGGYTGGGGATDRDNNSEHVGGGGGSYNDGSNQDNQDGVMNDHGMVVINPLSSGASDDAGVASIDEPNVFCPGDIDVIVTLVNYGINQIDSVDIEWTIDGVAQTPVTHSSTLDTMGGSGSSSAQVTLGTYNFGTSPYDIKAWTSNPNGVTDTVNSNDTVKTTVSPNLPPPSGLTVIDSTHNSVTFTWDSYSIQHSNLLYSIVPKGNPPDSGLIDTTSSDTATVSGLKTLTEYDVYLAGICPGGTDTSAWAGPESFKTPFGCPPNAFCFNNAGATGRTGPTQSALDSSYQGTSLEAKVISVDGYQKWKVPQAGKYTITTFGAEGGGVNTSHRGQGGKAEGTVTFSGGETVYVGVGQAGQYGNNASSAPEGGFNGGGDGGNSADKEYGSSGGGASDVRIGDTSLTSRVIVAGGGGGGTGDGSEVWRRGGGGGGGGGYYGGGGGHGGDESPYDPGRGGDQSSGGDGGGTLSGNTDGGLGYGGDGGNTDYSGSFSSNENQYGGDGGGLAGQDGNDAGLSSRPDGGGGGSGYIGGISSFAVTDSSIHTGIREGHGLVIIEPQFTITYAKNDAGVTSINKPDVFCPDTQDVVVTIANFGSNQIDSVDIEWTVDGVQQTPVTYTDTLDTLGGAGSSNAQVNLGSYPFVNKTPYQVTAWTVNPNGVADTVNNNDTTTATLQSEVPAPSNLTVDNFGSSFVDFSWDGTITGNTWIYSIVPQGQPHTSGTYESVSMESATDTTIMPVTDYDIYVAEVCPGGTDTSDWTGPVNFTSEFGVACSTGVSTIIMEENWENGQGSWTGDFGTSNGEWQFESGETNSSSTGPDGPHDGSQYLHYEASGSGYPGTASIVSPALDLSKASSTASLSFYIHAYGSDISGNNLKIAVDSVPTGSFNTAVYDTTFNNEIQSDESDPYIEQYADLTPYIGDTIYLEITYDADGSGYHADLALDMISLHTCTQCASPTNLNTSNLTSNSVDLSWLDKGTGNEWQVEYGTSGYTPGNGTDTITDTTHTTITGLSMLSEYDIYVRSFCSSGDTSLWEGPLSIKTPFECPPNAFCFNHAGATGANGPTQSQLDSEYTGTNLEAKVTSVNGYQEWMVPQAGEYTITTFGAEGGGVDASHRGQGGKSEGTVIFSGGETVYVGVGQAGQYGHDASSAPEGGFNGGGDGGTSGDSEHGSSGGGASDVRIGDTSLTSRVIVAGGGGGGTGDGSEVWRRGGGGGGGGGYYGGGGGHGGDISPEDPGKGGDQSSGGDGGGTISGNTDGGLGYGGDGGSSDYTGSLSSNENQYGGDGGGQSGQDGNDAGLDSRADGGGGGSGYIGGISSFAVTDSSIQTGIREGHGLVVIEPQFTITYAKNDAGVTSIDKPDVFCPGVQDVEVTITNFGINQIDSVDINWSVDGTTQTPVTYNGTLDTIGGSGSNTAQVNLGSYDFDTNAPYTVKAWTVNPNGVADTVNSNDTTTATIQSNLPAPTNLTILDSTAQTVTFDWNIGSSQNSWIYVVVPKGDAPQTGNYVSASTDSATATGLNPLTGYDVYVAEVCPNGTDTSAWAGPASFNTSYYCPPTGYCFNHAGATGRIGPTQSGVDSAYTGTNLAGDVSVSDSGIQRWVVPSSGMYEISVAGAKGGGPAGGLGAKMKGSFVLSAGDTLNILVGQKGETGGSRKLTGSGGGGSFVVDDNNNPLIVAGGGGGGADSSQSERHGTKGSAHDGKCPVGGDSDNCDYNDSGGATDETYSPGGVFGTDAGVAGRRGGGGAGFHSDGEDGQSSSSEGGGIAYVNGGEGGEGDDAVGGFGGGGGANESGYDGGGGGGGYTGGGGATDRDNNSEHVGGGGGSYNDGSNQDNQDGVMNDHGMVVINPLSSGASDDAGVASIDEPNVFCPGDNDVVVTLVNYGINQIDSVDIEWTIDGVAQTPVTHSSTLDTMGGSGSSSAQVTLGTYNFGTSPYDIKAWTSNPNGVTDTVSSNDTTSTTVQSNLPAPTNITILDTSSQTVTFEWNGGSSQNSWIYVIVPQGQSPNSGTYMAAAVDSAVDSSLTQATNYDLYVAEVCPGGTDTSAWAGPESFKTPYEGINCPGATTDTLFTENWDSGQGNWTGDIGSSDGEWQFESGSTNSSSTGPDGPHDGSEYIHYEATGSGHPGSAAMVSPAIDLTQASGEVIMGFWLHGYGDDIPGATLSIRAGTSANGPFNTVYSRTFQDQLQSSSSDPYVQDFANLTPYIGQTIYLEIEYDLPNSDYNGDLAIDLIEIVGCGNPLIPEDAGVTAIQKPDYYNQNANKQFEVVVQNYGTDSINSVDIEYTFGNMQDVYTYNNTIAPQDKDTVSMPMLDLPYGNRELCAYTTLPGDSNTNNDGKCKEVYRRYTTSAPYSDDLEGTDYFMKDTSNLQDTQWELANPQGFNISNAHSGQNAWITNASSEYANSSSDYLYTPRFSVSSNPVDSLVFWHYYDTEQDDGGYIEYLNQNGNWDLLGKQNDTTAVNWYNETFGGTEGFSGQNSGWIRSSICIDSSHIQNMPGITQFRFVFSSDGSGNSGDGWAIDDLALKIPMADDDAGIQTLVSDADTTTTGDSVAVEVAIKNFGHNTQTSIPVSYQIDNQTPVDETWTGNLATNQVDTFTFNEKYLAPASDYSITTYTELANDGNHSNDTIIHSIISEPADQDVGIVDMKPVGNSYNDTTLYGKDISVKVWIHNFGKQDITSMDVEYEQNNNSPVTETWNGNLASGDTVEYTFNQTYNVGVVGKYDVCSRTLLSGDAYDVNDEYCEEWTGFVGLESNELPGFVLHQNIPNPANQETSIDFEVPYGGKAQFEVVDMFGRKLYSDELSVGAGRHTVNLNTQNWNQGIYYYYVTFDGHKLVRKMMIVK